MDTRKAVKLGQNSKGTAFAVLRDWSITRGNLDTFGVWELCQNYECGSIRKSWRCLSKGLALDTAIEMFDKKVSK